MDALDGFIGPRRARAESDLRRESVVELDVEGFHRADDVDGRRASERHSGGGACQPEHTIAAGRHHRRAAGGAGETGERSADPFRNSAGWGACGAADFAGKRFVCTDHTGGGKGVFTWYSVRVLATGDTH